MTGKRKVSIAMLGATGAVGSVCLDYLLSVPSVESIHAFGRSSIENIKDKRLFQYNVDVTDEKSYPIFASGINSAICTLGVGEPSKVSKEVFLKIDKEAVLIFARKCYQAGIKHFVLLSSVGINPKSRSFYLRTKGELVEALKSIGFDALSIFKPSMILTPENRYGFTQGVVLKVWPYLNLLLGGNLSKYRGVKVGDLGKCMGIQALSTMQGFQSYDWDDFQQILTASNDDKNE